MGAHPRSEPPASQVTAPSPRTASFLVVPSATRQTPHSNHKSQGSFIKVTRLLQSPHR